MLPEGKAKPLLTKDAPAKVNRFIESEKNRTNCGSHENPLNHYIEETSGNVK
jgi:hypothetical protein